MSLAGYSLFILLIAASNAALGFGGAVLLGHGPRLPAIHCDWRPWFAHCKRRVIEWLRKRKAAQASHAAAPTADRSPEFPSLTLTPIEFSKPALVSPSSAHTAADVALSLEAALAQLTSEVAEVRNELDSLDDRVRMCSAAPTVDGVEECVADLKQTGQRLYQQQTQAMAAAQEALGTVGIAGTNCNDAREMVEQRTDDLRQSLAQLDAWQVDPSNLADDCLKLLAATEQMMESCDEVGQVLASASTKQIEQHTTEGIELGVKKPHVPEQQLIHGVARS
jgi:hypothetical protein